MRGEFRHLLIFSMFFIRSKCQTNSVVEVEVNNNEQSVLQCAPSEFRCYACLDKGQTDCVFGENCCSTACFMLRDQQHDIMAKGCWSSPVSDQELLTPAVRVLSDFALPWNNQLISGQTRFCKAELCNVDPAEIPSEISTISSRTPTVITQDPQLIVGDTPIPQNNNDDRAQLPNQAITNKSGFSAASIVFFFFILLAKYSILTFGEQIMERVFAVKHHRLP